MSYQAKDFFLLQTELIDTKVDMAATKAIDRVIDQIRLLKDELKGEIHELRVEVNTRLTAVETKLGMVSERRGKLQDQLIDYAFKGGWILLVLAVSYGFSLMIH